MSLNTNQLPAVITKLKEVVHSDQRFDAAIVFGSHAKNRARVDSDIDLAVLLADDLARKNLNQSFVATLGRLASTVGRDVHLVDLERIKVELQHAVFRDGIVLFDRSSDRLTHLHHQVVVKYVDAEYTRQSNLHDQKQAVERALGRS